MVESDLSLSYPRLHVVEMDNITELIFERTN